MLPESPCPRAALALSDLQPQSGASTFAVGTGSGNWSTHGVGGIAGDSYFDKNNSNNNGGGGGGGGLFGGNRQDRPLENPLQNSSRHFGAPSGGLFGSK